MAWAYVIERSGQEKEVFEIREKIHEDLSGRDRAAEDRAEMVEWYHEMGLEPPVRQTESTEDAVKSKRAEMEEMRALMQPQTKVDETE